MTADSEQGRLGWRAVLLESLSVDGDWTTEPSTPEICRKARSGKLGEGSLSDGLGGVPGNSSSPGPVIGNRNSKIYHLSNCPDYSNVSEKNRVMFQSEASAVAAG